jgi:hypothetical protein
MHRISKVHWNAAQPWFLLSFFVFAVAGSGPLWCYDGEEVPGSFVRWQSDAIPWGQSDPASAPIGSPDGTVSALGEIRTVSASELVPISLESMADATVCAPGQGQHCPASGGLFGGWLRQDTPVNSADYGRGMTLVLDEEGKKYIRFLTWNQVWTTATENNPGTVDAYGELDDNSLGIGLRRSRFLTYSQLTERYLILLHMGINNQTFNSGGGSGTEGLGGYGDGKKPQVFIHDVWNEYMVVKAEQEGDFSLAIGAGLHYWNGVSRKSSSSTFCYLTLDAPTFAWPNIEVTDQFARQFGWYAKGKWRKLGYRLAINQPFIADARATLNQDRAVNIATDAWSYAGYVDWQFWDQEPDLLPYRTSSWHGAKSVFNIGAGFYVHPDSSGILDQDEDLDRQSQVAVGIDAYYDKPVGNCGAAATAYAAYYLFDYGDNYFRNVGIMNTGRLGDPAFLAGQGIEPAISGAGNAQPLMGTGEIFYIEGGYVLPDWVLGSNRGRLQPFGAFTQKNLDWLDDPAFNWDMGVNYLIDSHRAKLTFQYSLRPLFFERGAGATVERVSDGSAGQFIVQAQITL